MRTMQSRTRWLIGGIGIIVSWSVLSCAPLPRSIQDVPAMPVVMQMTDTKQADALATIAAALNQPTTNTPIPGLTATEIARTNRLATAVAATLTANAPTPGASNSPTMPASPVPATLVPAATATSEVCAFAFQVLDKTSNQPIANANILVTLGTRRDPGAGKTDATGYYGSALPCLDPKNSKLRVRVIMDRYQPYAATMPVIDEVQEIVLALPEPATPTQTPLPPTPLAKTTPVKIAPTKIAPAKIAPLPAGTIEILAPHFGESISVGNHEVRWRYTGQLAKGQGFDLLLWYEGDKNKKLGITDAKKIAANLVKHGNGEYSVSVSFAGAKLVEQFCNASYWLTVMVVQLEPYQRIGPESKGVNIQVEPFPSAVCQ